MQISTFTFNLQFLSKIVHNISIYLYIERNKQPETMKGRYTMNIKIKVYDGCKYDATTKKVAEITYNDVEKMEIKTISDAVIYNMGYDEPDEYQDYSILTFKDGSTATFRNSSCDIFRA